MFKHRSAIIFVLSCAFYMFSNSNTRTDLSTTFHFQSFHPTFSSLSFLRLHSSHSLTMRPHRIQVSSSRWDRLDEAEELDTSEEPLLRREPLIERMDLESASSSLHQEQQAKITAVYFSLDNEVAQMRQRATGKTLRKAVTLWGPLEASVKVCPMRMATQTGSLHEWTLSSWLMPLNTGGANDLCRWSQRLMRLLSN